MKKIVIIGNGVAGVTVARELRKRGLTDTILIISGETKYHFSRTALMYLFMGHLNIEDAQPYADEFWAENNIDLLEAWVEEIDPEQQTLTLSDGKTMAYSELVIATGSTPNRFGWPGQDLPGVQSLYSMQDVELLEENMKFTKRAVICGGGLIGVEMAEMLLSRGVKVIFLVREKAFWNSVLPIEEAEMIGRLMLAHGVDLRLESELDCIVPGDDGRVAMVQTKSGEEIPCELVALTVGVRPNIDWLKSTPGLDLDRGVLVDHFFKSSLDHVWSVGDCTQFREPLPDRRPIEQVWYTGKMQATYLAANLSGSPRPYQPGVWWNSAKFFDMEYQTYGTVLAQTPEGQATFYWELRGENRSLRIRYDKETMAVCGMNIFGIRHRHDVWEQWVKSGIPITDVLAHLSAANFDPEFFRQYEPMIIAEWNREHPEATVVSQSCKGLFSRFVRGLHASAARLQF